MAEADRPTSDAAELWHSTPIAIVGMGGVFPGASSLDHFWRNIVDGVDVSREPPPGRWVLDASDAFSRAYAPDKVASTRACFVEHDPTIDDEGLDLDPHLIAGLDPL